MSPPDSVSTPAARPRWYQFRLRTLLAAVTLIAAALWATRVYVEPYRAQRQTMELIKELGGRYVAADPAPWQRRLLGGDQQNITLVDLADCDEPEKYLPQIARLPCLETLVVGGEAFGDEQLRRLAALSTLRGLVLDSTSVSEAALASWRDRFPTMEVHASERQAIAQLPKDGIVQIATVKKTPPPNLAALISEEHFQTVVSAGIPSVNEQVATFEVNASDLAILSRFPHLATLRLFAKFDEAGLRCIDRQHQLTDMSLAYTFLTDADLQLLRGLSKLERLDLKHTDVTDAGLAHLTAQATLKVLDLRKTHVGAQALYSLAGMTNLESLDLAETGVNDDGLASLGSLPRLKSLNLDRTGVTDSCFDHLRGCTTLESLNLRRTRVTGDGLRQLSWLLKLKELNVEATNVDDAVIAQIRELRYLTTLSLDKTRVTDAALSDLKQMSNLKLLCIRGTKITRDGAKALQEALPLCKVEGPRAPNAWLPPRLPVPSP